MCRRGSYIHFGNLKGHALQIVSVTSLAVLERLDRFSVLPELSGSQSFSGSTGLTNLRDEPQQRPRYDFFLRFSSPPPFGLPRC